MNDAEKHFCSLEHMYLAAPINEIYNPQIIVSHEYSEIEINITKALYHSAGAVHGAVYFKMLDDAAFFAANSIIMDTFVLTTSFTTYLTRPITSGTMKSVGRVVNKTKSLIISEAIVYNEQGKEIGRGIGQFVRGKQQLVDALGYTEKK